MVPRFLTENHLVDRYLVETIQNIKFGQALLSIAKAVPVKNSVVTMSVDQVTDEQLSEPNSFFRPNCLQTKCLLSK